MAGNIKLERI